MTDDFSGKCHKSETWKTLDGQWDHGLGVLLQVFLIVENKTYSKH